MRAAPMADALPAHDRVLLFTSPSGDGLQALVRVDPTAAYLDTFRTCADYLGTHYASLGLVPNKGGKDVVRTCPVRPGAPSGIQASLAAPLKQGQVRVHGNDPTLAAADEQTVTGQ